MITMIDEDDDEWGEEEDIVLVQYIDTYTYIPSVNLLYYIYIRHIWTLRLVLMILSIYIRANMTKYFTAYFKNVSSIWI